LQLLTTYNSLVDYGKAGGYAHNLYLFLNDLPFLPIIESGINKKSKETIIQPDDEGKAFQLFPNPTQGIVYITWTPDNALEGEKELRVYGLKGDLVFTQSLGDASFGHQQIQLNHLSSGIYQCILYINGNKVQTEAINVVR
jgi:hypothetical protein